MELGLPPEMKMLCYLHLPKSYKNVAIAMQRLCELVQEEKFSKDDWNAMVDFIHYATLHLDLDDTGSS